MALAKCYKGTSSCFTAFENSYPEVMATGHHLMLLLGLACLLLETLPVSADVEACKVHSEIVLTPVGYMIV